MVAPRARLRRPSRLFRPPHRFAVTGACLAVGLAVALAGCGSSSPRTSTSTSHNSSATPGIETPAKLLSDICGQMVSANVASAVGASFSAPPKGSQVPGAPKTNQQCVYTFPQGTLTMTVWQYPTIAEGNDHFDGLHAQETAPTDLPGIGTRAFNASDGSTVVMRDSKLLRIDTRALTGVDKTQVSEQIALDVSSCWVE